MMQRIPAIARSRALAIGAPSTSRAFATEVPAPATQKSIASNEAVDPLFKKRVKVTKRPHRERPPNPGFGGRVPRAPIEEAAQKVYLPNFTLTLVRNGPAHASDPYTATFRVPTQLTKPDIVQFLTKVYGLTVLGIRTSIKMGKVYHNLTPDAGFKRFTRQKTIKTAYIQMDRPFFYPKEREKQWLNDNFEVQRQKDQQLQKSRQVGNQEDGKYSRRGHRFRGSDKKVIGTGARASRVAVSRGQTRAVEEERLEESAREEGDNFVQRMKELTMNR